MKPIDYHESVLPEEALEALNVVPGEVYFDATFGAGGHSEKILAFGARVVATDIDTDAIKNAEKKFALHKVDEGIWKSQNGNLTIYQKNFSSLDEVAASEKLTSFSGILFDLGVSSYMFDTASKGFSFSKEGPLDMRMDQKLGVTAADLLNGLNERELYELFTKFGQEPRARRLARDIVDHRVGHRIESTTELAEIVRRSIGRGYKDRIDPSTRVFMALRIAVNSELAVFSEALEKASRTLQVGGRLVVISFHSLEDKIVKDFFNNNESLKILTKKPLTASEEELKGNPRARSAKMRVAERL